MCALTPLTCVCVCVYVCVIVEPKPRPLCHFCSVDRNWYLGNFHWAKTFLNVHLLEPGKGILASIQLLEKTIEELFDVKTRSIRAQDHCHATTDALPPNPLCLALGTDVGGGGNGSPVALTAPLGDRPALTRLRIRALQIRCSQ
jgi:hypothetical protein